jgi:hypothetical protein
MAIENLALRTARNCVRYYNDESANLLERHAEAMDCRDCEDLLQLGIDAFHWLGRADQATRAAVYRGQAEYDPSFEVALATLYAEWLRPCVYADRWAAVQEKRGFHVENLDKFRQCCEEVRAIVEANAGLLVQSDAMIELRDNAIDSHRKGETVHANRSNA